MKRPLEATAGVHEFRVGACLGCGLAFASAAYLALTPKGPHRPLLAVATAVGSVRFCAVAALAGHWSAANAFTAMTTASTDWWTSWVIDEVIAAPAARKSVLVASGPRPRTVPGRIETLAAEPIAMPLAPLHTLRLLAVRPAPGVELIELPHAG